MTRILGYSLPFAGHLFPMVGTLLALRERGHEALLAVGPGSAGLNPIMSPEQPRALAIERWATPREAGSVVMVMAAQDASGQFDERFAYGAPAAEELTILIEQAEPDAVIVDPTLWGALIAAEASRLRFASLAHSSRNIPTHGERLFGPGVSPPTGMFSRFRHGLAASAANRLEDVNMLPHFNRLRQQRGLPSVAHVRDQYHAPHITIACTAEPFEYPRTDWARSVVFVGPVLWEPPASAPTWINDLDERPLVLVSTSSVAQADDPLVEIAFRALAGEDFQVVATVLTGQLPSSVPHNARAVNYVPHRYLFHRTSCVLCHAGLGITQKALAAGIPVVAAPFGRDQFEVARRVEVARAGTFIRPAELSPERVRAAVRDISRMKEGAERIAAKFAAAGGAASAAVAIEDACFFSQQRTGSRRETSRLGSGMVVS